jgi:Zn-finger domain-containing protein
MQIKIQPARPPSLICMKLIFDLKTGLEKICSLLGKSAQTCVEISYHVIDAERAIKRIDEQLRNGTSVAGNIAVRPEVGQ